MQVLKAPDKYTRNRITSEGEVFFEDGIATEFTKAQAEHFCANFFGYSLVEIADKEPPESEVVPEETEEPDEGQPEIEDEPDQPGLAKAFVPSTAEEPEQDTTSADVSEVPDETEEHVEETSVEEGESKAPWPELPDEPDESGEPDIGDEKPPETEEKPSEPAATGGGEESKEDDIILPVIQDHINVVRAFAKKHKINAGGSKKVILERIYADQRFKK